MAANLFPLVYKAGIDRDGTKFQSGYCTDAFWMRFQRGKIKKIGGMKGVLSNATRVSAIRILPNGDGQEILCILWRLGGCILTILSPEWVLTRNHNLVEIPQNLNDMWTNEIVVDVPGQKTYLVSMLTKNLLNINANTAAAFWINDIALLTTAALQRASTNPLIDIDPKANAGLVFAAPYLFVYGSDGVVQHSRTANPLIFTEGEGSGLLTISNDKVIYGAPIRGGSNSPTVLFWTLSSVVRVTNVPRDDTDFFRSDTLSASSSILSSKCVVEYDGLFFWPGTERFYVYNGIVQEMSNTLNLNYFFDNIDMARRQQVFGVKQTKYGEIWWFYPIKGVPGANTGTIIYNKRENSWYDTGRSGDDVLSRTAGTYSSDFGFMATYGKLLAVDDRVPAATENIWRHEEGHSQNTNHGGNLLSKEINSFITTPVLSWSAFPPKFTTADTLTKLVNRWIDLQRIEPDFINISADPATFTVSVNIQEYAQSPITSTVPIQFDNNQGKIDMRVQGRNITLTFTSSDLFEVGNIILLLGVGDAR